MGFHPWLYTAHLWLIWYFLKPYGKPTVAQDQQQHIWTIKRDISEELGIPDGDLGIPGAHISLISKQNIISQDSVVFKF